MKNNKSLLILGGDSRQLYMPEYLISKGFDVSLFGFDSQGLKKEYEFKGSLETAVHNSDVIILPLPSSRDAVNINAPFSNNEISFAELALYVDSSKILLGAMLPKDWINIIKSKGIRFHDYFTREDLALLNAVPTAEGVVGTLIFKLPVTLKDSKIAITGFGRCGAALAKALKAMGAAVTIAVRNSTAIAKAQSEGYNACYLEDLHKTAGEFDAIVNTVPAPVVDRKILSNMNPESPVIEIASAPFGIDFSAAQELKIKVIKEGSIPGRTSPKTAGKIISDTICNIFKEAVF